MNFDGVQNSVIRNNLVYGYERNGLAFYQDTGGGGSQNNQVIGNTIYFDSSNGYYAISISGGAQPSSGNQLFDNIFYRVASSSYGYGAVAVDSASLAGFKSDYNVVTNGFNLDPANGTQFLTLAQWQAQTGQDMHSLIATPAQLFVNGSPTFSSYDFHLAAGSPAINAGVNLASLPTDITGKARPTGTGADVTDIGAYEF
jgi:hypothetical protein